MGTVASGKNCTARGRERFVFFLRVRFLSSLLILCTVAAVSCARGFRGPDLGGLYNALASHESPDRNPVVVIPGILGSRLVRSSTGEVVWGDFGLGRMSPGTPEGARLFALPMETGESLNTLRDDVMSGGALDRARFNFLGYPLELNTYAQILSTLGVGGYRDEQWGLAGLVDYGDSHFTCFQFDYDWRRDIVESAKALDRFLEEKRHYVQTEIEKRFGIPDYPVRFDLVAHSMGGLVARYYLRYGSRDLPADGSLPPVTWAGAELVDNLVMIGTPNGGSLEALHHLIYGLKPAALLPLYRPAILGTMPSVYQLLPRARHRPLLDQSGRPVTDLYDPELWINNQWGLADPKEKTVLRDLLHDAAGPDMHREIAIDHLRKSLVRARQFAAAMDRPAEPPAHLQLLLVAGDSEDTRAQFRVADSGRLETSRIGPGDGTVLRRSALLDERDEKRPAGRLISPIDWDQVLFLFSDHLGLTRDPAFTDNLLYFLLERPRKGPSGVRSSKTG